MSKPSGSLFILDGNPDVRFALEGLLRTWGWDVHAFETSAECLQAASAEPPRCIVSELSPPGMDSVELHRALQSRGIEVPMVVLTTQGDTPLAMSAKATNIDVEVLGKVCEAGQLQAAIGRAVLAH